MLLFVAKVINFFTIVIQNSLYAASCVGQIIVQMVSSLLIGVFKGVQATCMIFQIIYEDNTVIFTDQLPEVAQKVYESIILQCNNVYHRFMSVSDNTISIVLGFFDTFKGLLQAICVIILQVLLVIKNTIIFAGDTTWLILTFLPIHLPQLLKVFLKNIGEVIIDEVLKGYGVLLRFTNFLSDVPLESFCGMMSALLLIRLCVQFRAEMQAQALSLYWYLVRQINFLYHAIYNYVTDSEDRVITSMSGNEDITLSRHVGASVNDVDDGSDSLCVICQERLKCVLTLPCRHICLCTECCRRLYSYQRTCPICRTFIYHSVTVYL